MGGMFSNAVNFNQDISNWDTFSVTDMGGMFYDAQVFDQDLSGLEIQNVTNMKDMLDGSGLSTANYDATLIGWYQQAITDGVQTGVNLGAEGLTYSINAAAARHALINDFGWSIYFDEINEGVDPYEGLILFPIPGNDLSYFASSLEDGFFPEISHWDTSSVTNMAYMLNSAYDFNQDLSGWNTSSVMSMDSMFRNADAFNQDISGWDISSVTSTRLMFADTENFNQDIGNWNTSSVTDMNGMFMSNLAFNQDISNWDTSSVTDMNSMFMRNSSYNVDISNWDTSNVNNMSYMFYFATDFDQDLSGLEIKNVSNMWSMLDGSGLSMSNYDATLNGWYQQALTTGVQNGVNLGAVGLTYSANAAAARNALINDFGWSISGDSELSNLSPTTISLDNNTVDENSPGAHIANITGIDPDGDNDNLTFSIVEGLDDHDMFMIINNMLHLKTDISADYEDREQIVVTLKATDSYGYSYNEQLIINVIDDPEDQNLDEIILGTFANDTLSTLGGIDEVYAYAGDDTIIIDGLGSKIIDGGSGVDHLIIYPNSDSVCLIILFQSQIAIMK